MTTSVSISPSILPLDGSIGSANQLSDYVAEESVFSRPTGSWLLLVPEGWEKLLVCSFEIPPDAYEGYHAAGGINRLISTASKTMPSPGNGPYACLGFAETANRLVDVDELSTHKRACLVDSDQVVLGIYTQRTFRWKWTSTPLDGGQRPEVEFLHDLLG